MTSIQTTRNTITIQPLYKWDSEESQMTYLNLYPKSEIFVPCFMYFSKNIH